MERKGAWGEEVAEREIGEATGRGAAAAERLMGAAPHHDKREKEVASRGVDRKRSECCDAR